MSDVTIEAKIARLGAKFDMQVGLATRDIYTPLVRGALESPAFDCHADVAYGPDERQKLDLYRPGGQRLPVVVFVPGGGFVAGNKNDGVFYRNVGAYFASHGMLGIVINYRLAPAVQWPAGVEDVARAVRWVREHCAEFGGDPSRVILIGQSAGAAHSSGYLFGNGVERPRDPEIACAILMSGFYAAVAPLPPPIMSYFGPDETLYPARSPLRHVAPSSLPVLLSVAEFDPGVIAKHTFELAKVMCEVNERPPAFNFARGHNHVSTVCSLGSGQDDVGAELRHFIARHI